MQMCNRPQLLTRKVAQKHLVEKQPFTQEPRDCKKTPSVALQGMHQEGHSCFHGASFDPASSPHQRRVRPPNTCRIHLWKAGETNGKLLRAVRLISVKFMFLQKQGGETHRPKLSLNARCIQFLQQFATVRRPQIAVGGETMIHRHGNVRAASEHPPSQTASAST